MASYAVASYDVASYDVTSYNVASYICQALDGGAVAPGDVLARAAKAHPRASVKLSADSMSAVELGDHAARVKDSCGGVSKSHDLPDMLIDSVSDDPHSQGRGGC